MSFFFTMTNKVFDFILSTQSHGGRYIAIVLLSAVSAVVFMAIFKKTSNQEGIKREKNRIVGNLFQMRLYKDDLGLIMTSIFNIFKHNLYYMKYMLVPLLVIILPLMLITVQVNQRCGYAPLNAGQQFLVEADVKQPRVLDAIGCRVAGGLEMATPVMRIYDQGKAFWRAEITSDAAEHARISFYDGSREIGSKLVRINTPAERFIPQTVKENSLTAFLYNAEGFLSAASPLERITITYPRAQYAFLLIPMDAVVLYFILTLIFALVIKPFFRVTI